MSKLEVVYYLNTEDKFYEPVIKENDKLVIDRLVTKMTKLVIDNYELGYDKNQLKLAIKINGYIKLLEKGYTFEEIYDLLQEEFYKQYQLPGRNHTLLSIEEEKEALSLAYQVYVDGSEVAELQQAISCTKKIISNCKKRTHNGEFLKRNFI